MDDLLEKWKKEMDEKLNTKVEIPPTKSRCPKCMKPTLEFDVEKGCFRCTNCGFEYCVKKVSSR
ncbi:hypothetical protein KY338_06325 [Candidatus Woesearchaeota archaeon]|nr:hypothetical protein [Candidatus Woesearchaeota archaeon]MBW3005521.1 hypothetical protein [Candidatus Woesearchaeota archaeon]